MHMGGSMSVTVPVSLECRCTVQQQPWQSSCALPRHPALFCQHHAHGWQHECHCS